MNENHRSALREDSANVSRRILCASIPETTRILKDICIELGYEPTLVHVPQDIDNIRGHFALSVVDVNLHTQPQFSPIILADLVGGRKAGVTVERGLMMDVLDNMWGYHRAFVFGCSGYCRLSLEEKGRITAEDTDTIRRSIADVLSLPPHEDANYFDYVTDSMLHSVLESSLAPVVVFRRSGPIWFANLAAQAIFRRPTHLMKGVNVEELLASRESAPVFWNFVEQVARKPGDSSEFRMKARDGTEFDALIVVNRIFSPDIPDDSLGFTLYDITERKQAEAEVIRLKSFYEQILQDLPAQVSVLDPQGRFLYVNPSGVPDPALRRKLVGHSDVEYCELLGLDPGIGKQRSQWLARVMKEKQIGRFEEILPSPSGDAHHFIRMVRPIFDAEGNLTHFIRYGLDVTDTKRAMDALRQREREVSTLLDSLPAYAFLKDANGVYVMANRNFCDAVGCPQDEIAGRTDYDLFPPDLAQKYLADDQKLSTTGEAIVVGEEETIENGRRITVVTRKVPLKDEEGRIVGLIGLAFDISDRKRAETALQEALSRFESVIEMTPLVAIQGFDRQGLIRHWNSASRDLYGYESSEVLGARIQDVILSKETAPQFEETIERIWSTGQGTEPGEWQITTRRGDRRWVYSTLFPIQRDGAVDEIFCMDVDITDRKRAEEERLRLEAQVQHAQKLESLGVLAGGIAHDFNNLLMGILGYASLALMELPNESPARDSIEKIEVAGRRAAELTKQMLAYSGKGKFVIQAIDVSTLVEEMAHLLEVSVSKSAILKYNLSRNLPPIEGDSTQVRQVVMNLIINASDAIGDKSGVITLTTGAMDCDRAYLTETYLDDNLPEGVYVYFEVSDTGCGMDAETRARIFDPFFTTKFTGRGLGLAAVLGIVRGHRGALKVYSETAHGSTFKVLFPACAIESESMPEPHKDSDSASKSGTILVVDDEETVRTVARQMLERCGYTVLTANDGREGLEAFRKHQDVIAAVLLDMTMPHLNGDEVFREIRRIKNDACVILSSGYNEQEATDRFAGKGLAGFIQKPYRVTELALKLQESLEQWKARNASS